MVTYRIHATPDPKRAKAAKAKGALPVALYHAGSSRLPGLGRTLEQAVRRLPAQPSLRAWDLLSFALSVFAADRFVLRSDAADGWTRVIDLTVELVEPQAWLLHAKGLGEALTFLTGDLWTVSFIDGGIGPPEVRPSASDRDCVCLFSGGLDSLVGAVDLLSSGRAPLLASQASPKEGPVQEALADAIGLADHRFVGRASERFRPPYEPSSRARSLLFFAYGVLAASALRGASKPVTVFVPENGLIAINPPLTYRRVGSLSTRTTHPFFISSLQKVLDAVKVGAVLVNPYVGKTKGEMLLECSSAVLKKVAHLSYSCGKGKRLNMQCGRCVPCLIRRAAMERAGIKDKTPYHAPNLANEVDNDDVMAVRFATAALKSRDVERWAAASGPLPYGDGDRERYIDVVRRGLDELRAFVSTIPWS